MTEKILTLPFITKTPNQKEELSYAAELAFVVWLAESQRKKPSFLRDASEKITFISKVGYPIWVKAVENACLIIDGLSVSAHDFTFEEPTETGVFIEELKKNAIDPSNFMETVEAQAKGVKEFTSPVKISFPALIYDRELLNFFLEYFKSGTFEDANQEEDSAIPSDTDSEGAMRTTRLFNNCLRTLQADTKGMQYALSILKEELEFHRNALTNEIEGLEERLELETATLKPIVEKAIKNLTQKQDRTIAVLEKGAERKNGASERKREKFMHKLQALETKKDSAQRKIDAAKKKKTSKSSSGSFALKKYEREVENTKKEIRAISDDLDRLKKEGDHAVKLKKEEFQNSIAQEESKITQLSNIYASKTGEKQRQIEEMTIQAGEISNSLENKIDELKLNGDTLRSQIEVDFKLENTEESVFAPLPVYLVKYTKGEEQRYNLLSPISISEDVSVLNGLKKMLALSSEPKTKTLARPANKKLHETLMTNLLGRIQSDASFRTKINEICRSKNIIDLNTFGQTLNEGLDEIEKKGWMSREEASELCRKIMRDEA
jgi:hypothetical protein